MRSLLLLASVFLVSAYSYAQGIPENRTVIRDDLIYHQETNELVTGTVEKFYDNGELEERTTYKDGKREGLWEYFRRNGQPMFRQNYKDGKPEGFWEWFNEDGRLQQRENYKDGELDGLRELFDRNGQLRRSVMYRSGEQGSDENF